MMASPWELADWVGVGRNCRVADTEVTEQGNHLAAMGDTEAAVGDTVAAEVGTVAAEVGTEAAEAEVVGAAWQGRSRQEVS